MSVYGAHEARIYYVQESTFGVTPTNPSMLGVATADNVEPALDPGLVKLRGLGSRDLQTVRRGLRHVDLKVSYALPSDAPINLLQHVTTLNSLSIEVFYEKPSGVIDLLHKGCRIDKVAVECSVEDLVKASAELIGQDIAVGTSKIVGATYADYNGAVPFYESYVQRGAGDGSGLATVERVVDWKFRVENNLKRVPVIRSTSGHLLKYLQERHRVLAGELTFEFESKQEYDDVLNDSDFSLKFGLGGTSSALFKYCKWERVGTPTKVEDLVSLKAPFVARDVVIS
ncbi:MAG TPA: phage tail tube protein [Candidatus Bathyarchaeia archaeon]|nr:phage tail tube protein [Candidatus Bathyarchaeia archaeon]